MSEKAPKVKPVYKNGKLREDVKELEFDDGLSVFINDAGDVFFRKGLAEITVENGKFASITSNRKTMKG